LNGSGDLILAFYWPLLKIKKTIKENGIIKLIPKIKANAHIFNILSLGNWDFPLIAENIDCIYEIPLNASQKPFQPPNNCLIKKSQKGIFNATTIPAVIAILMSMFIGLFLFPIHENASRPILLHAIYLARKEYLLA